MRPFPFRFLLIFPLLALLSLFPLAAQSEGAWELPGDTIEEIEGRGLLVRSNPSGARVFIDGIERGLTPLHLEKLRAGRYHVLVQKEAYRERRFRVSVRPDSLVNVHLELREAVGRVLLKIQRAPGSPAGEALPFDPGISVDGGALRRFPSGDPAMELPVGFRNILVRAFGWEDATSTLYVEEDSFRELELSLKPAAFKLSGAALGRKRFNPANAGSLGTTSLAFEVSAPGAGTFSVLDREGRTVFSRGLDSFETWSQSVVWNGRNSKGEILGDGIYTLAVQARSIPRDDSAPAEESLSLEVELDSAGIIHPATLFSGKSGLLFAPFPQMLPPGSFQIEAGLLAGKPAVSGGSWKSLPFAAAFRFSPIERLEVSAAMNLTPFFDETVRAGFSGGAKWVFSASPGSILSAGAGLAASWMGRESGLTPFGMASGVELYFPVSLKLGELFSFALSPALLWTGDEGFPWESAPRLLVSGGLMARFTYVIAGLSLRGEYNFSDSSRPPSMFAAAEVKVFPPPSSFVFSFFGGVWIRDGSAGGFGGLGIGMIY